MLGFARHEGRTGAAGPPVLLLHCWSHDRSMWDPQVEGLRRVAREVLVPDLPGHGTSPVPPGPFTFDDLVDPVVELLGRLDVGAVVAVGLSLGAAVAVQLAIDHPDRVAGLVLADSARPDGPDRARRAAERIRTTAFPQLLDDYEEVLFAPAHRRASDRSAIARWRRAATAIGPDVLADLAAALHARRDPGPALPSVDAPTLVVHGELDAAVTSGRRDDYLGIPGSRRVELAGAGHLSNLDDPETFSAHLEGFVRALGSSARP